MRVIVQYVRYGAAAENHALIIYHGAVAAVLDGAALLDRWMQIDTSSGAFITIPWSIFHLFTMVIQGSSFMNSAFFDVRGKF